MLPAESLQGENALFNASDRLDATERLAHAATREEPSLDQLKRLGFAVDPHAAGLPVGRVYSLEPSSGDPRFIAVLPEDDREPFWIDRRTMRAARTPRTSLVNEQDVLRVADLADRAQLALGQPLSLRFAFSDDRAHVTAVEALQPQLGFTSTTYRRVAPFIGDKSTLSPLSVDALDRALRVEEDRGDEHRVRRIFGRAYRKVDAHHTPWSRGSSGRLGSLQRLTRISRDVALPLADARRFRSALAESVARQAPALAELDRQDLAEALRRSMGLVVSALVLLERSRMASLSLLPPLERVCRRVARANFLALAAPIYAAERVAIDKKLQGLLLACTDSEGRLTKPRDAHTRSEWERVRRTLRHVRSLGMDVRAAAIGSDDEQLLVALMEVRARYENEPAAARKQAVAALTAEALRGRLGPLGVAPALALAALLERLAEAKGRVAEGLSAALLSLRAAALEAGHRLSEDGLLERADDTLYMTLEEIEQALEGELGAYAARARLRREDDRRWRHFDAPLLIERR
jgi:hypothetical protein